MSVPTKSNDIHIEHLLAGPYTNQKISISEFKNKHYLPTKKQTRKCQNFIVIWIRKYLHRNFDGYFALRHYTMDHQEQKISKSTVRLYCYPPCFDAPNHQWVNSNYGNTSKSSGFMKFIVYNCFLVKKQLFIVDVGKF